MQPLLIRSASLCAMALLCMAQQCDKRNGDARAGITGEPWRLSTLAGKPIELPEGTTAPDLRVGDDLAVSGFGGCNRFSGQARMDGGTVAFPNLMRTKMYCEKTQAIEEAYLKALGAANAFKVEGRTLRLLDKDRELATLVRP